MDRELRRSESILYIVGTGVIAIGIWSVLKTVMFAMLSTDTYMSTFREFMSDDNPVGFIYGGIAFGLALDLAIRLWVGLSARAEGKGKKKSPVYLVLAFLMLLGSLFSLYTFLGRIIGFSDMKGSPDEDLGAAVLVELTSLVMLCEMEIEAFRVRRMRKALEKQG